MAPRIDPNAAPIWEFWRCAGLFAMRPPRALPMPNPAPMPPTVEPSDPMLQLLPVPNMPDVPAIPASPIGLI